VIVGNAIEIAWDRSTAVVTGDISNADRQAFIGTALQDSFGTVDTTGLVVLENLADEADWIGTVLSLAISMREEIVDGRLIVVPGEGLLVVTGTVDDKILRNALNKEVGEAALAIGFDANPAVRVPPDVEQVAPPTEEEVEALQIDIDALLKDKVVEFEVKSDVITATGIALLEEILEILSLEPDIKIEIAGHADAQGNPASNMILSQARADAVLVYLIAHDESPDRYTAVGYGETQPIADNATEEGRARNRRIEFRASLLEESQ
jgi:OOP family OmpA-OmpF porin